MQTESYDNPLMAQNIPIKRGFTEKDRARQWTALWILAASGLMGLIGDLFFYHQREGVNVVLFVGVFLGVGIGLLWGFERPISKFNILFIIPAIVFAVFLGVYSAPFLTLWNVVLMIGSLFLVVRYATTAEFLGGNWFGPVVAAMEASFLSWIDGPLTILPESSAWFKQRNWDRRQFDTIRAILRGLMLTVPIVVVFGLLLSSADVVFGDLLNKAVSWLDITDTEKLISHMVLIGFFGWLCIAGYKLLLLGPIANSAEQRVVRPAIAEYRREFNFRLGLIEAGMVLGSIDVLFGAFVIIQARYLFGGEANITAQGYTYSDYARRGFFELLAVSLMTMGLVLALDQFTHRKNEWENRFRGLAIPLVGLTMVLLVAAFRRLSLYEDAYGFTRLRVMTQVFMVWLGVLFVVLIGQIVVRRREIFWIGSGVVVLCFVGTLNVMNMDGFIATQNIERFEDTGKLDVEYLMLLSDDAIPSMVLLLDRDHEGEAWYGALVSELGHRLYALDDDQKTRGWFGYHIGKARAWKALDAYRDVLGPYVKARSPEYGSYGGY